jgi:hypothetical protein
MAAGGVLGLFLVAGVAHAASLSVEIRNSEVWLIEEGKAKQLTHDGKAKEDAILSPSEGRIAYFDECPETEHCTPDVVILDLEGHRLKSFQPQMGMDQPESACGAIISITWEGDLAIAAECHLNPSLSEYIETELSSGRRRRDLLGYDFTPSPDGGLVAHVGAYPHFAPPYAQSNYLQLDDTRVYPLPKDTEPVEVDGTYTGIHEFGPGFYWSPDSRRIAFIDCTYKWTPNSPGSLSAGEGRESGRKCALAVVETDGRAKLFPLADVPPRELNESHIAWAGPHKVSLAINGSTTSYAIGIR